MLQHYTLDGKISLKLKDVIAPLLQATYLTEMEFSITSRQLISKQLYGNIQDYTKTQDKYIKTQDKYMKTQNKT